MRRPAVRRIRTSVVIAGCLLLVSWAFAQEPSAAVDSDAMSPLSTPLAYVAPMPVFAPMFLAAPAPMDPVAGAPTSIAGTRILGVIPDYQTVTETNGHALPLTTKEKWALALKESIDPFNIGNAAMTAGFSQKGNQTPKYGEGWSAYGKRFGAAIGDFSTQNIFSAGVLATVLHQDPRYFRKGPVEGIPVPHILLTEPRSHLPHRFRP